VLYAIWGAIGLSVLVEFGLLLFLQRGGRVVIAPGSVGGGAHVGLSVALFAGAAVLVVALRSRIGSAERLVRGARARPGSEPAAGAPAALERAVVTRYVALSIVSWAVAEALALVGFAVALALPPVPRLALTVYFTGAMFLWLLSRPVPAVLDEARRRAAHG
jgi:hypothetical protein